MSAQRPQGWSLLESLALLVAVLIWSGVCLGGVGLVVVYLNLQSEAALGARYQLGVAAVTASATPTDTPLPPMPTDTPFPPTPTSRSATPTLTDTPTPPTPTDTPAPPMDMPITTEPPSRPASRTIHRVESGENLSKIAARYGVTVEAIVEANGMEDPGLIHVGQELTIPFPGQNPPASASSLAPSPTPSALMPTPPALPANIAPTPAPPSEWRGSTSVNGPPTRIVAPAIGLDAPVVPVGWQVVEENNQSVSIWEVADYAAGWHKTSAYPGQKGNVVISGHHNIRGEVFRYVVNLEPGDEVDLYAGEKIYRYAVVEKHILKEKGMPEEVRRQNAQWIAPTVDERLTLVTCWPYTSNTHRVIAIAKPLEE
ncbi:MAG: sortase [Anaerolineae bacterium]